MINNDNKNRIFHPLTQLAAGLLPGDNGIEFFGNRHTKKVAWLQNGMTHSFSELPSMYFDLLKRLYHKSPKAMIFIKALTDDFPRQIEIFTYYMFGDLNSTPDIKDGVLSLPENFRDKANCPSLLWNLKNITIHGHKLSSREIFISDLINNDVPDKAIAFSLKISHPHLDTLKRKLFKKAGVMTKPAFLKAAILEGAVLT